MGNKESKYTLVAITVDGEEIFGGGGMKEFRKFLLDDVPGAENYIYSNLSFAIAQAYKTVEVREVKDNSIGRTVKRFKLGWIPF